MIVGGDLCISVALMAHPSRAPQVEAFASAYPELGIRVAYDPEPERRHSLATAIAAWELADPQATHHLVIQDDILPCQGFTVELMAAVRAHPDAAISLFCEWGSRTGNFVRLALLRGEAFALVADPYTPTQALVLPVAQAAAFAAFARGQTEADDLVMHRYLRLGGVPSVVTAPNLVEHDDRPSLTGNGFQGPRYSAAFAAVPAIADRTPRIAGAGHEFVPHVSWMRLLSEWFYCGPSGEISWQGTPIATRLPDDPGPAGLAPRYTAHRAEIDRDGTFNQVVSDTVMFEVWLGAYALGLISGVGADVAGRTDDPLWDAALATAFPGAFRRYLSGPTLARLGPLAVPLLRRGVQAGADDAVLLDVAVLAGVTSDVPTARTAVHASYSRD